MAVLIIACPVHWAWPRPMSIMVATGRGAAGRAVPRRRRHRKPAQGHTLIIDKTGTLTEGHPSFDRPWPQPGVSADEVLRLAASLDQGSEHPLAGRPIVSAARRGRLTLDKPEQFESRPASGARHHARASLALGNTTLMAQLASATDAAMAGQAEATARGGRQRHAPGDDGVLAGLLAVPTPSRRRRRRVGGLQRCHGPAHHRCGRWGTASLSRGGQLGIDLRYIARSQAARQTEPLELLQKQGRPSLAGDGINDAPALRPAPMGHCHGHPAPAIMNSAQLTLVRATCAASPWPAPSRRHRGQHEAEPGVCPSSTTPSAFRWLRGAVRLDRLAAVAANRRTGNELQLGLQSATC